MEKDILQRILHEATYLCAACAGGHRRVHSVADGGAAGMERNREMAMAAQVGAQILIAPSAHRAARLCTAPRMTERFFFISFTSFAELCQHTAVQTVPGVRTRRPAAVVGDHHNSGAALGRVGQKRDNSAGPHLVQIVGWLVRQNQVRRMFSHRGPKNKLPDRQQLWPEESSFPSGQPLPFYFRPLFPSAEQYFRVPAS